MQKVWPTDAKVFLGAFEKIAVGKAWPEESWWELLLPFSVVNFQTAYCLMGWGCNDYGKFKGNIQVMEKIHCGWESWQASVEKKLFLVARHVPSFRGDVAPPRKI